MAKEDLLYLWRLHYYNKTGIEQRSVEHKKEQLQKASINAIVNYPR